MGNLQVEFDIDKILDIFKERDIIEFSLTEEGMKLKTYRKNGKK